MNYKTNLQASFSDQRTRVFFLLMVVIIVVVSIFAYFSRSGTITQNTDSSSTQTSSIVNPGASIESTPGVAKTSQEYNQLQKQYDADKANQALSNPSDPQSALPTLSTGSAIPGLELKQGDSYQARLDKQIAEQQRLQNQFLNKQQSDLEKQQIATQNQQMQALLGRQAGLLARNWQVMPQQYVAGKPQYFPDRQKFMLSERDSKDKQNPSAPKIYYKAGDILFGVILTSVNSDEPSPVLARIISGPLANSKIIGNINPTTIPIKGTDPKVSKALVLQFNLMNIPESRSSISINAIGIDPQTARTGLATSVDNHYFLRYGSFFAANFLAGLGGAISMQSQTKVVTGTGSTDIGRTGSFSAGEEALIGLGKTAEALATQLNFLEVPPTIKVASGTAVGILLLNDIVLGGDNNTDTTRLLQGDLKQGNLGLNNQGLPPTAQNQGGYGNPYVPQAPLGASN